LSGWIQETDKGPQTRGRDFKLVHEIDKEIARFSGIDLKADKKNISLTIEKVRLYLDTIMGVIFRHVPDEDTQQAILKDLDHLDEGQ